MKLIAKNLFTAPPGWMGVMRARVTTRFGSSAWIGIGLLLLIVTAPTVQARIYKWVDADGKVQYSEKPPPEGQFTEMKPGQPPSSSAGEADRQLQDLLLRQKEFENRDEADKAKNKEKAAKQAELEQDCANARNDLTMMENKTASRLTVMDDGGAVHRLSEDERQSKIAETRKFISDKCQ